MILSPIFIFWFCNVYALQLVSTNFTLKSTFGSLLIRFVAARNLILQKCNWVTSTKKSLCSLVLLKIADGFTKKFYLDWTKRNLSQPAALPAKLCCLGVTYKIKDLIPTIDNPIFWQRIFRYKNSNSGILYLNAGIFF